MGLELSIQCQDTKMQDNKEQDIQKQWNRFRLEVGLIAALDHSGRAGNYFFQSIFDTHPEVITCPWIQYVYSYFTAKFSLLSNVAVSELHPYWTKKSYFRLAYQDADGDIAKMIVSFGSDPNVLLDRPELRRIFDQILSVASTISRRDVMLATYFAYVIGLGRNPDLVKYVLVSDAVTLKSEDVLVGFSGRIAEIIKEDFPEARFVSLERDPRATFASCRHQYVNTYGSMYNITFRNAFTQTKNLLGSNITQEGNVYLYWLLYFAGAARVSYRLKKVYAQQLLTVKNEDLNLSFVSTIRHIINWLGVDFLEEWNSDPYMPTNVGGLWLGKGAYNNLYQENHRDQLKNDTDDVSRSLTGPNKYVTERWKSRLLRNEIEVIEFLFRDELDDLGYPYLFSKVSPVSPIQFIFTLLKPFAGEIPNTTFTGSRRWRGLLSAGQDTLYFLLLPIFYIGSRLQLLRAYFILKKFELRKY